MQRILIAALLVAGALAGCLTGDSDDTNPFLDSSGMGKNGKGSLLDAAPEVPAADVLSDLKTWAETNNQRRNNVPTHEQSRVDLLAMFESYGLETYRQDFSTGALENQANIIGIKWGEIKDQWVVVGGHYDTMTDDCLVDETPEAGPAPATENPCPLSELSQGMYDDGSGTMLTVHMAKAFAGTNTKYTMAFVALDGEELGTNGARAFVDAFHTGGPDQNWTTPYGQIDIVGAVDLDMIGLNWPGVNNPVNVLTNSEMVWETTSEKMTELGFPEGQVIRKDGLKLGSSDYARFWEVTEDQPGGVIPTVFFIAGFEEVGLPSPAPEQIHTPTSPEQIPLVPFGIYPFWHLEDTWETMVAMAGNEENLEAGFQSAADTAAHVLWQMAANPDFAPDAVAK